MKINRQRPKTPNCWKRMEECVVCSSYILYRRSITVIKHEKITRRKVNSSKFPPTLLLLVDEKKAVVAQNPIQPCDFLKFPSPHREFACSFVSSESKVSVHLWSMADCCWLFSRCNLTCEWLFFPFVTKTSLHRLLFLRIVLHYQQPRLAIIVAEKREKSFTPTEKRKHLFAQLIRIVLDSFCVVFVLCPRAHTFWCDHVFL